MIRVEVSSLAMDSRGDPVVVLRPLVPGAGLVPVLPIWIGLQEANAIMLAAQGETAERPMSYDLMVKLLESLGGSVVQVAVTRLEERTFYAEILLETPTGIVVLDARPSDSIALAMRTDAPILVAEEVFEEAGVTLEEQADGDEESEIEAFSEFLDTIDPEDFKG